MIIKKKNIPLRGKHGKPILTDIFYDNQENHKPVVIFCHGYKGFKDWGAWDLVAAKFAEAGFFFIKFNFSHNGGTIEQPIDFPDLEAFGQNNYIKELDDLESVINWVTVVNFEFKNHINSNNITLIGHSRGGGISIIKAYENPLITKLITWASVCDYESRFPKGQDLETWKKNGVMYIENGRTKQQMPHYYQFYTSFLENKDRLTISKASKNIQAPHLIVHGSSDPTVDIAEAKQLHTWSPKSELFIVKDADHIFGVKHPWNKKYVSKDIEAIVQKSIEFVIL